MFDKVIQDYKPLYERIVKAVARNAASKYDAKELLRSAAGLQAEIQNELEKRFKLFHATVVAVQLRQIQLPSDIQSSLQGVLNEGLLQEAELKKRTNTIAEFDKATALALQDVDKERTVQVEQVERSISVAFSSRKEALRNIAVALSREQIGVESERKNLLAKFKGQLQAATDARIGDITKANNREAKAKIENEDKEAIAAAAAKIKQTNANSESDLITNTASGDAFAVQFEKEAATALFDFLKSDTSMSNGAIVRHNHYNKLESRSDDSDLYIDYKKVPLFREAPGNTAEIGSVLHGQ